MINLFSFAQNFNKMEFTAQKIAEYLKGTIEGNPDVSVNNISRIEEGKPGTLTFLANPQYTHYIYTTNASVVLVNEDFQPEQKIESTLIRVKNAYQAFASLLELYEQGTTERTGIDSSAFVDASAKTGENVYIGNFSCIGKNVKIGNNVKIYPQVYIEENVEIGDNTVLRAGVKVYSGCKIGAGCIIHSGAVIGSDGFGFAPQSDNNYKKVPQIGNVIIEDSVEIGANTTIDRATIGSTIIRKGVKLDNLIQVAHNCEIGENTVVAAQTGIAGSSKVGKNCMLAAQVGITGHVSIPDDMKIGAQSGVTKSFKKSGEIILGSPAVGYQHAKKQYVFIKKLPELAEIIYRLEKEVEELKKQR